MKQNNSSPYIYVIGNEKGGAGKTTCSMHLISGIMDKGYKVASIDTDSRQHSLTTYINNRRAYNLKNSDKQVQIPTHFHLTEGTDQDLMAREQEEKAQFENTLKEIGKDVDYIVIDTPGTHSHLSKLAHSYANTVITPINDSFLDVDVIAKISPTDLSVVSPSIYSQMIWEQKMQCMTRENRSIEWIVMRNRLSNIDAINKRNIAKVLEQLSKRISFKIIPGFSERVIFRELFLQGLTLLDLTKAAYEKSFSISHVAARQELRNFLSSIGLEDIASN